MITTPEHLRLSTTNVPVEQAGDSNGPAGTRRPQASKDDQGLCVSFLNKMLGRPPPRGCETEQDQCDSSSGSTALSNPSFVPPHERPESASNVPFAEQQPSPCDQAVVFSPPSRTPLRSYTNESGQDQYLSSESAYPNSRQPPRFARKTQPRFARKKTSNSNNPKDGYRAEKSFAGRERSRRKSIPARGNVMNISSIVTTVPCFEMEVDGGDSVMVEEVPNWEEEMRSLPLALRRERRVTRKPADLSKPGSSKRLDRKNDHTPLIQNSSTSVQCVKPPTAGRTSKPEDLSTNHENTPRPTLVQRTRKISARKRRKTKSYEKKENTGKARGRYLTPKQRKEILEGDPDVLAYSCICVWCAASGAAIKLDSRKKGRLYNLGFWVKHKEKCQARANKEALDKDEHLVKEKTNPYSVECAGCRNTVELHPKEKKEELKVIEAEVNRFRTEAQEKATQEERKSYEGKEKAPLVEGEMNYDLRSKLCESWYAIDHWLEHKKTCTGGRGAMTKRAAKTTRGSKHETGSEH